MAIGGRGGLMCFSTTIPQENQHLYCVQPQLSNNVPSIFKNHYSKDEKQSFPATFFSLSFFFFLKKNSSFFYLLFALSDQPFAVLAVMCIITTREG